VRTTPITLLPRRAAARWTAMAPAPSDDATIGARAARVADHLRAHGASFFDEIVDATGMMRTEVEDALGELVAQGRVSSDSFAGLRALLTPSEKRKRFGGAKRRRTSLFGIEDAGRWSLHRRAAGPAAETPPAETVEHVVHALLQRYGVVFWRMLERESTWLPPWRDMLRVLRRLEARGDVRGGRFVAGVSGEQFALPDAVALLRDTRREPGRDEHVVISGADPLNLVGTLLPGAKVPALTGNRILFRDGLPVAALVGGVVQPLAALEAGELARAESLLIARQGAAPLLAYLR
jgi:ATP-dependent Lhr-like helicase